jgi:hypothetical protein
MVYYHGLKTISLQNQKYFKTSKNGKVTESDHKKFSKQWFREHPKDDREMFELIAMYFPVMIAVLTWALYSPESYNAQISVAFMSLIVFLWFIIGRSLISEFYESTRKTLFDFRNAELNDITYTLITVTGLLAVISVLFVINLEILSNSAVRIGAVAAFGLFTLLKQAFMSFKY